MKGTRIEPLLYLLLKCLGRAQDIGNMFSWFLFDYKAGKNRFGEKTTIFEVEHRLYRQLHHGRVILYTTAYGFPTFRKMMLIYETKRESWVPGRSKSPPENPGEGTNIRFQAIRFSRGVPTFPPWMTFFKDPNQEFNAYVLFSGSNKKNSEAHQFLDPAHNYDDIWCMISLHIIWVFPKIWGKLPKWMVFNGKPY